MGVWIETKKGKVYMTNNSVTPCMGVWIETDLAADNLSESQVTPCMGVWIEIYEKETH